MPITVTIGKKTKRVFCLKTESDTRKARKTMAVSRNR